MALTDKLVAIANAIRAKTGKTGTLSLERMATEISGIKTGITPIGTLLIVENGEHDVTEFAGVNVNVPSSGITPSGTKEITQNGTFDISSFASVLVNVPTGMNGKVFTSTVSSDVTSGNYTILAANEYVASIRSNAKAFVVMVALNSTASTAMYSMWMVANFTLMYTNTTARNAVCVRTTTSANNIVGYGGGMTGTNGAGHLQVQSDGSILVKSCNTTYPLRAGNYLIIAGVAE